MSAHVLLNLLNELEKEIKCEVCRAFNLFFCNEFDKFNNTGFYLSYNITIILKSHFWRENVRVLLYAWR